MILSFFHAIFYVPLYNALIYLIDILPFHDVGLAVVVFTIIIKLILFPLSYKAVKTQAKMKIAQVEIDALKAKYPDKADGQKLATETFAVYKKFGINPFAGFLTILIQIPILISLSYIFFRGSLPVIHIELLYPFIHAPEVVNMIFLGLFDVSKRSIIAAVLVGVTQLIQGRFAFGSPTPLASGAVASPKPAFGQGAFKDDFMRGMQIQVKYVFPVLTFLISLSLPAVVPLYWIVSNLFIIGQEIYLRKKGLK